MVGFSGLLQGYVPNLEKGIVASMPTLANKDKIILDLCGGTGSWSEPYRKAGYTVIVATLPDYDVTKWREYKNDLAPLVLMGKVYGILAAPPCVMFSRARTTAKTARDFHLLFSKWRLKIKHQNRLCWIRLTLNAMRQSKSHNPKRSKSRRSLKCRNETVETGRFPRLRNYANMETSRRNTENTVASLMEVIRWHLNPETARTPFQPLIKKEDAPPNNGMRY